MENLHALLAEGKQAVAQADSVKALDEVRVQYLGKKGHLTQLLKGLGKLSAEERPAAGAKINEAKAELEQVLNAARDQLEGAALEAKLASETVRITSYNVCYTKLLR